MWDGRLGRIDMAKDCIELTALNVPPIFSAPSRDGPKAFEFKKTEIDKKPCMKFIVPVQRKRASLFLFVHKERGFAIVLYWLQDVEHTDGRKHLPNPWIGKLFELAKRSGDIPTSNGITICCQIKIYNRHNQKKTFTS